MRILRKSATLLILSLLLALKFVLADVPIFQYMAFSGVVTIDGINATQGTLIRAFLQDDIDTTEQDGNTTTTTGGRYSLLITNVTLEEEGRIINFTIGDFVAKQTSVYMPQGEELLNLSLILPPSIPNLFVPVGNIFLNTPMPLFDWDDSRDQNSNISYLLQISETQDFNPLTLNHSATASEYLLTEEQKLADSTYNYRVITTDNYSYVPSESRNFTIDTMPPFLIYLNLTGANYANGKYYLSPADLDKIYNSIIMFMNTSELVVWGRTSIYNSTNSRVKYFNAPVGNVTSNTETWDGINSDGGNASEGVYTINTTFTDRAGNINTTIMATVIIDNTNPAISYETKTEKNDSYFSRDWIYIEVNISEENEGIVIFSLYNDSGDVNITPLISGSRNINLTNLPDNAYWYNVTSTDLVEHKTRTETRKITLDTIVPSIRGLSSGDEDGIMENNLVVNFTVDVDDANIESVTLNNTPMSRDESGNANTYYSYSSPLSLGCSSEGICTLTATARDNAGNIKSVDYSILIDNSPPVIINEINKTIDGIEIFYNNDEVFLNATIIEELSGIDSVWIEGNWTGQIENITLHNIWNGNYSYVITEEFLENGENVGWRYFANDTAGNLAIGNINTFSVTNRNPEFNGAIPNITFLEEGASQQINLSMYFSDPDLPDDNLTFMPISHENFTTHGGIWSINLSTGVVTLKPDADYNGTSHVIFTVRDSFGLGNMSNNVTITVIEVNKLPSGFFPFSSVIFEEDSYNGTIGLDNYFEDHDGSIVSYSYIRILNADNISVPINPVSHIANISSAENWFGNGLIAFTAIDNENGVGTSNTLAINVTPVNDVPIITGIPALNISEDSGTHQINLSVYADDVETPATDLIYSVILSDLQKVSCGISGVVMSLVPHQNYTGIANCTVIVNDTINSSLPIEILINVTPANDNPTINSSPVVTALENSPYSYQVNAYDIDGDLLAYQLTTKSQWMEISSSGLIGGVPRNEDVGNNNVVVKVTDTQGSYVTQSFVVSVENVNNPPNKPLSVTPINNSVVITDSVRIMWNLSTDIDAEEQIIIYSVYNSNDSSNITFIGSTQETNFTATMLRHNTTYFWFISASDGIDSINSTLFTYYVSLHNPPAIIGFSPNEENLSIAEGSSLVFNLTAMDIDIPPDSPLSYLWTFDGEIVTASTEFDEENLSAPSISRFVYNALYNHSGSHLIEVVVKDATNMISSRKWGVMVMNINRAPVLGLDDGEVITIKEDSKWEFVLNSSDEDVQFGDFLNYSINDSRVNLSSLNATSTIIEWTPMNDDVGSHIFNITVRDRFNGSDSKSIIVNVENTNDAPVITSYLPINNPAKSPDEVLSFNISYIDVDTVTWFINGNVADSGVSEDGLSLIVANLEQGSFNINATVTDLRGTSDSRVWNLIVSTIPVSSLYTGSILNIPLENISNATGINITEESLGVINYGNQSLNLSGVVNLDDNLIIRRGIIGINSQRYPQLNKSAVIELRGLIFAFAPIIYFSTGFGVEGNKQCPESICTDIKYNSSSGVLRFSVSQFSTYFVLFENSPPVANAGDDKVVFVNTPLRLDGSASSDIDKDNITFKWSQVSGYVVILDNDSIQAPIFTPDIEGDYVFQLIVNDGNLDSLPDTVTVTAKESELGKVLDITNVIMDSDGKNNELKPGETLKVKVDIKNRGSVNIRDIELNVFFETSGGSRLEDDDSEDIEDDSEFDMDAGDDQHDISGEDVDFTFYMPYDVEDGEEYTVHVEADGFAVNDSSKIFSDIDTSEKIAFVRDAHDLLILGTVLRQVSVKCERNIDADISIRNIGEDDEDVVITVVSPELGIDDRQEFTIEADGSSEIGIYNVREDADAGVYSIPVNIEYGRGSKSKSTSLSLTVENCEKQVVVTKPTVEDVELKVIPSPKKPSVPSVKEPIKPRITKVRFRDTTAYLALLAVSFIIITIAVVSLTVAYFVNGRRG